MFSSVWLNGWALSAVCSLVVFLVARKALLQPSHALILSACAFTTPLFLAVKGTNSVVYCFDFAVPVLTAHLLSRWRICDPGIKKIAILIMTAAGVVPLLVATIFSSDRTVLLGGGINAYRLLGCMSLMCISSRWDVKSSAGNRWFPLIYIVPAVAILIAMVLAKVYSVNTDVLSFVDQAYSVDEMTAFNVLGLFRGSTGIFGVMCVASALCATESRGLGRLLGLGWAIIGVAIILVCGSKTSLISLAVSLAIVLVWNNRVQAAVWAVAITVIIMQVVGQLGDSPISIDAGMLALFESGGAYTPTLDDRASLWDESVVAIAAAPSIMLGRASPNTMPIADVSPYTFQLYHNEYLSLTMLGGVWALLPYLAALRLLLMRFFFRQGFVSRPLFIGQVLFISGVIQAATVGHFYPGILYGPVLALTSSIYGVSYAHAQIHAYRFR